MLVKLYNLPDPAPSYEKLKKNRIELRRALAPEKSLVVEWVNCNFSSAWADECEIAFSNKPVSCHIALRDGELIGFACYDAICRNFFRPFGSCGTLPQIGHRKGTAPLVPSFNERDWICLRDNRRCGTGRILQEVGWGGVDRRFRPGNL